jgi:hypothetical protein
MIVKKRWMGLSSSTENEYQIARLTIQKLCVLKWNQSGNSRPENKNARYYLMLLNMDDIIPTVLGIIAGAAAGLSLIALILRLGKYFKK